MTTDVRIAQLSAEDTERHIGTLSELLAACVAGGASVNFVLPYTAADAEGFWRNKVLPRVRGGEIVLLVAWHDGRLAGTAQLDIGTPPNQPHRAGVCKVMVDPEHRRRGIGRALMRAIDETALRHGRTLLTLDTRSGDAGEPLYRSHGYTVVGTIPGYSLSPFGQGPEACTFMYKTLA
jgi:ribosomal protein S18 acetylase RimI-like enzyme